MTKLVVDEPVLAVPSLVSIVCKIGRRDRLNTREELQSLVYYLRHGIALSLGILFGVMGLEGLSGVFVYVIISIGLPLLMLKRVLGVSFEEFSEEVPWLLLGEALWLSFLFFLLVWTVSFSAMRVK